MPADLLVESISASGPILAGTPVRLSARIKNVGSDPTPWFRTIYVRWIVEGKTYIGAYSKWWPIYPGYTETVYATTMWTPSLTRKYDIVVEVDITKRVEESNESNNILGTTLGADPTPVPTPDPTPSPTPVPAPHKLHYGRYFMGVDTLPISTQVARWGLHILQGQPGARMDQAKALKAAGSQISLYVTPLTYRPDPSGVTSALPPGQIKDEWILRNSSGAKVQRDVGSGLEYAVDMGNSEYQRACAAHLVNRVRIEGWNQVFFDEINQRFSYGRFSSIPAKYTTDASWQQAQKSYLVTLSSALAAQGVQTGINLGSDPNDWAKSLLLIVHLVMAEFFTSGPGVPTDTSFFRTQLDWAAYVENSLCVSFNHVDTNDPAKATFGLCAHLLVQDGHGIVGAGVDAGSYVWSPDWEKAQKLGKPLEPYVTFDNKVYNRKYEGGLITLNASTRTASISLNP